MGNMKVGFVGLGKLGLPVAVAMSLKGHDVMGHDLDPMRMSKKPQSYMEAGPGNVGEFNYDLAASSIQFGQLFDLANHAEDSIIFVAVQTPHDPKFEGVTPLTEERQDFDYTFLRKSIQELAKVVHNKTAIAIISTVLPGTIKREILPYFNSHMKPVYNPSFIAMGQTMWDFLNPEFILVGVEDDWAGLVLEEFYHKLFPNDPPPLCRMSIESAELTKVAYNTFIGGKIVFANTIMEICHRMGADVDCVMGTLKKASNRLISSAYMDGGMGDGGGCHPRDNIAMSWLANQLDLSHNLFDDLMVAREDQAVWLAKLVYREAVEAPVLLPIVIVGIAYKPGTNLTVGSPALLVQRMLEIKHGAHPHVIDNYVSSEPLDSMKKILSRRGPAVFLIGCKHPRYGELNFPKGSIVIDPFRFIPDQEGVKVIGLGRSSSEVKFS